MDKKLNPLDGEIDLLGDTVSDIIRKLNPLTGRLELVYSANSYIQKINPFIGDFDMVGGTGASYIIKEATGSGYINLTNAVANHLMELKAYGGTELRSTLPSEYTQLDYITLNKGYFDTGITPTTDTDYELKFTIAQNNTTQGIMGMLNNSTPANNFYFMVSSGNKFLSALGSSAITLTGLSDAVANTDYIAKVNGETLTVNGVEATNFTRGTLEATQTIDLGCRKNSENNGLTGKLYYFKIWKGGNLVAHYIPCKRNSDDVLGYYDIVNSTFGALLTQYGTPEAGSSTLIPTPDVPIALTCNNGVLKFSKNMANVNSQTILLGYYISAQGVVTADTNNRIYQQFIPVKPSTTYTLSMSSSVYYVSISEYTTTADSGFVVRKVGSTGSNTQLTITTGATTNYVRFGTNIDRTEVTLEEVLAINWQLERGSTPTPYHEYVEGGIYIDGNTETIEITGKNLNGGGELDNKGYTSTGGTSTSTTFCGTLWKIKVKEGEKYTVSYGNFPDGISGVFVNTWKTDGTWNTRQAISIGSSYTYTIPSGIGEVNFTLYKTGGITIANNSWLQVEKGETATSYEPYYNGGTATAEMLLNVGDYVDEQEILSGNITRNVGIKVLDGTENFGTSNATFTVAIADRVTSKTPLVCSHFEYSTKTSSQVENLKVISFSSTNIGFRYDACADTTAFKTWLTNQYNAGTPVIVVYPLAEPTTETVAGQTMNIQTGSNTISITQASIDNLGLYAKYKATE